MLIDNFVPYASISVAVGASAVTTFPVQTAVTGGPRPSVGTTCLLQNTGAVLCFFKFVPASGGTADANSTALQPGSAMVFDIGAGDYFAPPLDGKTFSPTGIALFSAGVGAVNISMGRGELVMLKAGGSNASAVLGGVSTGDSSGTPGNATINARSGRCAIAAGQASVTITNNNVTAASHCNAMISQAGADATLTQILRVAPGAGAFTIFANAVATAAVQVDFIVVS